VPHTGLPVMAELQMQLGQVVLMAEISTGRPSCRSAISVPHNSLPAIVKLPISSIGQMVAMVVPTTCRHCSPWCCLPHVVPPKQTLRPCCCLLKAIYINMSPVADSSVVKLSVPSYGCRLWYHTPHATFTVGYDVSTRVWFRDIPFRVLHTP